MSNKLIKKAEPVVSGYICRNRYGSCHFGTSLEEAWTEQMYHGEVDFEDCDFYEVGRKLKVEIKVQEVQTIQEC